VVVVQGTQPEGATDQQEQGAQRGRAEHVLFFCWDCACRPPSLHRVTPPSCSVAGPPRCRRRQCPRRWCAAPPRGARPRPAAPPMRHPHLHKSQARERRRPTPQLLLVTRTRRSTTSFPARRSARPSTFMVSSSRRPSLDPAGARVSCVRSGGGPCGKDGHSGEDKVPRRGQCSLPADAHWRARRGFLLSDRPTMFFFPLRTRRSPRLCPVTLGVHGDMRPNPSPHALTVANLTILTQ
jgi:hypothetical protein